MCHRLVVTSRPRDSVANTYHSNTNDCSQGRWQIAALAFEFVAAVNDLVDAQRVCCVLVAVVAAL